MSEFGRNRDDDEIAVLLMALLFCMGSAVVLIVLGGGWVGDLCGLGFFAISLALRGPMDAYHEEMKAHNKGLQEEIERIEAQIREIEELNRRERDG